MHLKMEKQRCILNFKTQKQRFVNKVCRSRRLALAGLEVEVLAGRALGPRDAFAFAAVGIPEPLVAILRRALLGLAELALAIVVVPLVAGHTQAILVEGVSSASCNLINALADAGNLVPVVGMLAVLPQELALGVLERPVLAGRAVLGDFVPVAGSDVEPFTCVGRNIFSRGVVALAAAGVFVPDARVAGSSGSA